MVYPLALYDTVLGYHQGLRAVLVDLGTGHGVIPRTISCYFEKTIGVDPSPGMLEQAKSLTPTSRWPSVSYQHANAEDLSFLEDGSADVVVAGQAAHWFDQAKLWPEMSRILRKGGTLAFWGYKDCVFPDWPKASAILTDVTYGEGSRNMGDYWSQPGRSIVQDKLRPLVPPDEMFEDVQRIEYEPGFNGVKSGDGMLFINKRMKVVDIEAYVRSFSAYHGWKEAHKEIASKEEGGSGDIVDEMFEEMKKVENWGNNWKDMEIEVEWGSGLLMARRR